MHHEDSSLAAAALSTEQLLTAIAEHGPRWPQVLGPKFDQLVLNSALDREYLAGHVIDAITLSAAGATVLARAAQVPVATGD